MKLLRQIWQLVAAARRVAKLQGTTPLDVLKTANQMRQRQASARLLAKIQADRQIVATLRAEAAPTSPESAFWLKALTPNAPQFAVAPAVVPDVMIGMAEGRRRMPGTAPEIDRFCEQWMTNGLYPVVVVILAAGEHERLHTIAQHRAHVH